ncbi:MAG: anthranilate phosphoribosyltransferase [Bacteroidales bacterium]
MKDILNKLLESRQLNREEAGQLMHGIAELQLNEAQIAAVLSSYIMRSISLDELLGFRDALLDLAVRVDLDRTGIIDLCGTGGDGKNTFNISTLSSFVVAGSGIPVAKHGNYGVSSITGSSNLMEHFGYKFSSNNDKLRREIDEAGICFMHAPLFHPALKAVGPVRRQLGIKTIFNIMGPLVNPANPLFQLSGVFNIEAGRLYSYLMQREKKQFIVIHSLDGYDEVSLTSAIKTFTPEGEGLLEPSSFNMSYITAESLHGGEDIAEAAEIFLSVLENRATTEQKNTVLANSALAISCFHNGQNLGDSVDAARESIDSGKALQSFKKLIEVQ